MMRTSRGFTLVELLIGIAVIAILLTLAGPSFRDMILMQRLRSVNAQLVTDFQLARSEAAARNEMVRMHFQRVNGSMGCYTIYTAQSNDPRCLCTNDPGAACQGIDGAQEIRTVQVPWALSVQLQVPAGQVSAFAFTPATGGIMTIPLDEDGVPLDAFAADTFLDSSRKLRTIVNRYGRPTVCRPEGSTMDVPECPL